MSNLLFDYTILTGEGDSSFAVDYMVERIIEEDAIYAQPTLEIIDKVNDLANYSSPEDADDYIWSWLDGIAEKKGTYVYTLMFDRVFVSDGTSFDLYLYRLSEEDEEAIEFAGTPLEESKTLNEIRSINNVEFEALVDRLADNGFKYYSLDPNYDRSKFSIFLWLEEQAGDNQRAFTISTHRNPSDKLSSISLFVMPGEQAFYYDNPVESDLELLQALGSINEVYKGNWDKDLAPEDFKDPEILADVLVQAGASFIDPGFFYEEIALDVDRGYLDDDDPNLDEYYEKLAQALFDAYGDDKLYYTFYYDDPYGNDVMLFSDGGYTIIEDDYLWTYDDFEMVSGAGMLQEQDLKEQRFPTVYEVEDEAEKQTLAELLVDKQMKFVNVDKTKIRAKDLDGFSSERWMMEEIKRTAEDLGINPNKAYTVETSSTKRGKVEEMWLYVPQIDTIFIIPGNEDDLELFTNAGMLEEATQSSKWHEGIDWDKMYPDDIADALVKSDAVYVHPDKFEQDSLKADKFSPKYHLKNFGTVEPIVDLFGELYDSDTLHYTIFNDPLRQYTDKFITNRGEFWNVSPDGDDWTEEDYEMVIGAGQLNENIEESDENSLDIRDREDLIDHITKNGLSVREIDGEDIDALEDIAEDFWVDDFHGEGNGDFDDSLSFYENLHARFSVSANLGEMVYFYTTDWYDHLPFVGKIGDDTLWTYDSIRGFQEFWPASREDVEEIQEAGSLFQESLADQPTYVKIEALANDVVEQDLQYYELSNDEKEDLIELAAMIRDAEEPIAKWDKTIINILRKQRSETGKKHYTVIPTQSQIQYAEEQVIDFMYFDEFLTRFLSNADKSDIELLRGAGQLGKALNENIINVDTPSKIEDLADKFAKEGMVYVHVDNDETVHISRVEPYFDYIKEKAKKMGHDPARVFSIEPKIFNKNHDTVMFYVHVPETNTTYSVDGGELDIQLLQNAGMLTEDGPFGGNIFLSAEAVADKFADVGAEYIELDTGEISDIEEAGDSLDRDSEALETLEYYYNRKGRPVFIYVEYDGVFHYLDGKTHEIFYVADFRDLSEIDAIDLIKGAGQLNEIESPKYKFGNWWSEVEWNSPTKGEQLADVLASLGAEYIPEEKWNTLDKDKYLDNGDLDGYISDVAYDFKIHSYDKPHLTFSLVEIGDEVHLISSTEFTYDMWDFDNEEIDLIIGSGQLNESTKDEDEKYPKDETSVDSVASWLINNNAEYYELTSEDEEALNKAYEEGGTASAEERAVLKILKRQKHKDIPIYTYDSTPEIFYILFNDGQYGYYYVEEFKDVPYSDVVDMLKSAGQINEERKEYVDPLASITDASKGEQLADALANAGARFIDAEWLDKIEYDYIEGKYPRFQDSVKDIIDELRDELKKEDTIIFTYFQPERVFITYDGKYYETFFMSDFDDLSGTADVRMIIDAGLINEALDLEDPKIGDMIDAYTYDIFEMVDRRSKEGSFRELSSGEMYRYEHAHSAANYYDDNSWNLELPEPIAETLEDILGSSWMEGRARDFGRESFFDENDEAYREFYGMHDEVDIELLRDAGYGEWADRLEAIEKDHIGAFLDEDYEIQFTTSIKTNFNDDPESIYVFIGCVFHEFGVSEILKEVELGQEYNNIDSVEALRDAMKDFMENKVPKFFKGEKPAEITTNDVYEQQKKKPLKENTQRVEELISNIVEWPLHYVDPPQDILDSIIDDAAEAGMDIADIHTELWERLQKYIEDLDRKAGYIDQKGQAESDEGHFTLVDSDFFQDAGFFINSDQYFYVDSIQSDGYELTPQEYADVIEAGQLYDLKEHINESKEVEDLIDTIVSYPLHYVELEDSFKEDIISYLEDSGLIKSEDYYEIYNYVSKRITDYLKNLERNYNFRDDEGNLKTDEGFFTMVDSDFWEEAGYLGDVRHYDKDFSTVYTSEGELKEYVLSNQELEDVIEAGELHDIKEIKEQEEYNPTFYQISDEVENTVQELIEEVGRIYDAWGDPTAEELSSNEGFISFHDGGYRAHEVSSLIHLYGQASMPTYDADDKIETMYDEIWAEASKYAVEDLKNSWPEVYKEFSGDPELLTYNNLLDAAEAYEDIDYKRSLMYSDAAHALDEATYDIAREDDDTNIYFEVEVVYFNSNATMNKSNRPMLKFRGAVETNYSRALAAIEFEKTFESEEELQDVLKEGSKELDEWFSGEQRNKNEVKQVTEELSPESSLEIFELVEALSKDYIVPVFEHPGYRNDVEQDANLYSHYTGESYYIPLMKYLSNERVLPRDFQKNEEQYVDETIWEAAEDEVLGNIEEYISKEKAIEYEGINYELAQLYKGGDLEEIDPEFYEELNNLITEKYGDYTDETGVMQRFEFIIHPEDEVLTLIAKVELDPEYQGSEHKKIIDINIISDINKFKENVIEAMKELSNWMIGN